jgi:hypothetical protein
MKINTDFLRIPDDNGMLYVLFIASALKYSDPEGEMDVHKIVNELKITITPSQSSFRQDIIDNIVSAHKLLHLKPQFSKSTNIEKNIHFSIEF